MRFLNLSSVAHHPNKEWKPKASVKPSAKTVTPPADNPEHTKKEAAVLQDNISQLNHSESQNVIIAPHIRISETDRCRLTFGSLGAEFVISANSIGMAANTVEELSTNPSGRLFSFNFVRCLFMNFFSFSYFGVFLSFLTNVITCSLYWEI